MFSNKLSSQDNVLALLDKIDEIRIQKQIKKGELYAKAGLTASAVSQWRSGKTKPSSESIAKIADILEVPVSSLFEPTHNREINTFLKQDYQTRLYEIFSSAIQRHNYTEAYVIHECKLTSNLFARLKNKSISLIDNKELVLASQFLGVEKEVQDILSEIDILKDLKIALNTKYTDLSNEEIEDVVLHAKDVMFSMANAIRKYKNGSVE